MRDTQSGRRSRPVEGWGILLLTLGLLIVGSTAVANAGWAPGLSIAPSVALVAFLIGLLIAKSRLPTGLAHPFSLIIGFAWCFRLAGSLFPPIYTWRDRWEWLWWRMYLWAQQLLATGTADDNLVFVLQVALLVWLVGYMTMWLLFRRHQIWPALLVSGGPLLVVQYYAPNNVSVYLAAYLILALVLVVRFHLFWQQQRWLAQRVHFNAGELTFDFWRVGLALALLVVGLAWLAPTASLDSRLKALDLIRGPVHDIEYLWSRWFSGLHTRSSPGVDFSGEALSLGGPRQLPETPVLRVNAPADVRYRRMVTYDTYSGRTWENSDQTVILFGADFPPPTLIAYRGRQPVTFTVTALVADSSVLAVADQPMQVSRSCRASLSRTPVIDDQGEIAGEAVDTLSFLRSRIPFSAGEAYVVTALASRASEERLRADSQQYPGWITARYLQLPDTIPQRVRDLAATLTAAAGDTAYDRASAIEGYLRREITYNEGISAPPAGRDPTDYILFDLRQGYCDYYATAMVVMLRSVGIPARMAAGYSQGEYRFEEEAYLVTLNNAHSWVEVFFPTYGWIDFEPTAAQPLIQRPAEMDTARQPEGGGQETIEAGATEAPDQPSQLDRVEDIRLGTPGSGWLPGPGGLGAGVCLGVPLLALAAAGVWTWRRRWGVGLAPVEAVYHRMSQLARWAGMTIHDWQTPVERAATVGEAIPGAAAPAARIARIYTRHRYDRRRISLQDSADVRSDWQSLRPQLLRAVVKRAIGLHRRHA